MNKCPVCNKINTLHEYDCVLNNSNIYNISICANCFCLINLTAFENLKKKNNIDIQLAEHYSPDGISKSQILEEINNNTKNLNNIISILQINPSKFNFFDFGPGRGCSSIAAASIFNYVYAIDLHKKPIQNTLKILDPISNIELIDSIDEVNTTIDFFYAWHSIEHLPYPYDFFQKLKTNLSSNGLIAIQMPLYRSEYIIDCHYFFPGIISFKKLAISWGFICHSIMFDNDNSFITVFLKNEI